jgi:hypothetical protein
MIFKVLWNSITGGLFYTCSVLGVSLYDGDFCTIFLVLNKKKRAQNPDDIEGCQAKMP